MDLQAKVIRITIKFHYIPNTDLLSSLLKLVKNKAVLIKFLIDFMESEIIKIAFELIHSGNDPNFELTKQYNFRQVKYLRYILKRIKFYLKEKSNFNPKFKSSHQ